jgi:REP element-mobilizing transposase RayT
MIAEADLGGGACFSLPSNHQNGERLWPLVGLSITGALACPMAEYRRRLPHFHPDGAHLFVTWRLDGSLPVAPPDVIYATPGHAFAAEDRALAQGHGRLWLRDARVARQIVEAIRTGESRKQFYELQAWVVMPNHVHMLILPHAALSQITHWIKGRTAREANLLLGRTGEPFWQDESHDHWVRNKREFHRIVAYIEENPVSAGLAATPEDWPWSSAARAS